MQRVEMENKDYVIGIDIGSSNVVMSVGEKLPNGELEIVGVEVVAIGEGAVKDGSIRNFIVLGEAIAKAKSATEEYLGRRINSAYVGLSGKETYCVRYEDHVFVKDKDGCISVEDTKALRERIDKVSAGNYDEIVARLPLRYRIDERQYVKNPIGTFGQKLSATYLLVLTSKQQIELLKRAMHRAEMSLSGVCITPTVLPEVILDKVEMDEGVAIVDIGAELTDIVVVREGQMCHFMSLPIGASTIDADLREFVCAPKDKVELLKKKCVSVLAEEVSCELTASVQMAGRAKKQILQRNIAEIIEERLKDFTTIISKRLKDAKLSTKIPCGIVLTGGSAYLADIDRLFARELGMEVRLADHIHGINEESKERITLLSNTAVIGILHYGAQHAACQTTESPSVGVKPKSTPKESVGEENTLDLSGSAKDAIEPTPKPIEVVEKPIEQPADKPQPEEPKAEEKVENMENEESKPLENKEQYIKPEIKKETRSKGRLSNWLKSINSAVNNILDGNKEI